jgi:rubrerythrin
MDIETMKAYEWALNQNFGSVAAQYAKKLALYIQSAKSATSEEVAEAIKRFTEWEMMGWSKSEVPNSHCLKTAITALQEYQLKSDCEHKNRMYEQDLRLSMPPKRKWICEDCGADGYDVVDSYCPNRGRKIKEEQP